MNNELERILGDVADGAEHRATALPVDSLRQRGVRRRRTRQAGYGVIGVAAAFGLVLGTAQLLPDDAAPGPAAPSPVDWPTADPALPLGACGSVATNLPLTDSAVWLELSDEKIVAPVGAEPPVAVTVQNFGAEPLDLSRGEGPYLFVVRDGVVVGFSWPQGPPPRTVVDEEVFDDLGPFVLCEQGELRPSGDAAERPPLPAGEYTIHSAITLRPDSERSEPDFDWAFDLLGRTGTLTVTEGGADPIVWPPVDSSAPAGACGADAALPLFDPVHPLDITPRDPRVAVGASPDVVVRLEVGGTGIEDTVGTGPYLMAVRQDGVVVGYAWLPEPSGPSALEPGTLRWSGFGPFVVCESGEHAPSGDTDGRTPLPAGEYALWVAHQYEAPAAGDEWAFQNIEHAGTLTVTATADSEVSPEPPSAVAVALPGCGEPAAGWQFPTGVHVDPDTGLDVTVGHTGEDEGGGQTFFPAGYGDQLEITFDHVNRVADWTRAREIEARAVVAREGVVVAELSVPERPDSDSTPWPAGEGRSFAAVVDWVDCASQQHTAVPKGDYEILGWRTLEVTGDDGSTGPLTIGYDAAPFTAYDFEDADNPAPGACQPLPVTRLVDGSPAGEPHDRINSSGRSLVWGQGDAAISQRWGEVGTELAGWEPDADDVSNLPPRQVVEGPSGTHMIMPVGDFGLSEVQVRTVREGCATVIWLPAGTTLAEARAFAADL